MPHSNHSAFMWEFGGTLYLVTIDNLELHDVDIFDISDPAAPQPVAEHDLLEIFPEIEDAGNLGSFPGTFHHDSVVKMIDGKPIALTGYWDGGYVTYDLSDPFAPKYIGDSSYEGEDPLTGLHVPGGQRPLRGVLARQRVRARRRRGLHDPPRWRRSASRRARTRASTRRRASAAVHRRRRCRTA